MAKLKVLIATAEATSVARVRQSLLGRDEYHIVGTTSGVEALNKAKFEHPEVAVIDIALPDLSGDEVCREIRRDPDLSATIVGIMAEKGDEFFEQRARDAGANQVLSKPLDPVEIDAWLGKILAASVRRSVRLPLRIKVAGATSMGEMRGESLDLSSTGIRFDMTTCNLEAGYSIWLKFQISADTPPIVCKGEVVRVINKGGRYEVAVKFASFNGDGGPILRRFLRAQGA